MKIYIILYIVLTLLVVISWPKEDLSAKIWFFMFGLIVMLIPALRDISVGTDTITYVKFFRNQNLGYDGHEVETIFGLWNSFISLIFKNENFYLFVSALIPLGCVMFFIFNNSPYRLMSLLLFVIMYTFYFIFFSGIRQSFAIGFFLISLHFYNKKKYKKALMFYIVTVLFHTTALYCLLVLAYMYVPISKRSAYLLIIISFLAGLYGVFDYRSSISFVFNAFDPGNSILNRYEHYSSAMDWDIGRHRVIWDMLPPSFLGFICYRYSENLKSIYLKLFLFSVVFGNIIVSYPIGFRLTIYFSMLAIVVIPIVFTRRKLVSYYIYPFVISYYLYKSYATLVSQLGADSGNIVVNYKTFF